MINATLSEVVNSLSGRLVGVDTSFTGVSIDTRTLDANNLYIAISGENFDGHDFCVQAVENGAVAVVVEREQDVPVAQIVVSDCRNALRDLAIFWRERFDIPLVAVTGSSGKTTVKEMVFSIFSKLGRTLATKGNLNNDLGVPLTLLSLSDGDQRAVVEIGANHVGEIAEIVKYVRPTVAVITMIGPSHLEGFGSIEAIAVAKSEIFSGLQSNGVAVINRDDRFYGEMQGATDKQVVTFGMSADSDVSAKMFQDEVLLSTPTQEANIKLALLGAHNLQNALAAAAVATAANVDIEDIVKGLESIVAVPGRLQVRAEIKTYCVIDDTYNANPASVKAAIDVLDGLSGDNCLVLGDMGELGDESADLHKEIGQYAAQVNKQLFCIGRFSQNIADGYGNNSVVYKDMDAMFSAFIERVQRGSNILVKGSRSAGMERFIEKIIEHENAVLNERSCSI